MIGIIIRLAACVCLALSLCLYVSCYLLFFPLGLVSLIGKLTIGYICCLPQIELWVKLFESRSFIKKSPDFVSCTLCPGPIFLCWSYLIKSRGLCFGWHLNWPLWMNHAAWGLLYGIEGMAKMLWVKYISLCTVLSPGQCWLLVHSPLLFPELWKFSTQFCVVSMLHCQWRIWGSNPGPEKFVEIFPSVGPLPSQLRYNECTGSTLLLWRWDGEGDDWPPTFLCHGYWLRNWSHQQSNTWFQWMPPMLVFLLFIGSLMIIRSILMIQLILPAYPLWHNFWMSIGIGPSLMTMILL